MTPLTHPHRLSKSRFVTGRQCHKLLWWKVHEPQAEELQPDITGMWALDDGTLWVQTSRGDTEPPDGAWTVLDVFDESGRFVRQVALAGDHDALRDSLQILPDGRILVVVGALDAFLTQQAVGGEDAVEEAEPLEIICYSMEI